MTYAELIQVYFDRTNAMQSLWTLYVVIVGGMLAFSSMRRDRDVLVTALVSVLFCIFAFRNLDGIHEVLEQRRAAQEAVVAHPDANATAAGMAAAQRRALEATLSPSDYPETRNFHVAGDVLAVIALWAMEWRRRRIAGASRATVAGMG